MVNYDILFKAVNATIIDVYNAKLAPKRSKWKACKNLCTIQENVSFYLYILQKITRVPQL